jgi:hypothetical protein
MSKKAAGQRSMSGWRYICSCGYTTINVGEAVAHINKYRDHQLLREEL